jgi:DNA-binding response OmpR family regulator
VKRILIVDDEPDILMMMRLNLELEGYSTVLAADGATALRRVAQDRPDLVLLDVMMPFVDGWGVLEYLAAEFPDVRVVVLSAKSSRRDVVRAVELGAAEYITKPYDPGNVVAMITRVLESSAQEIRASRRILVERWGDRTPVG